MSSDFAALLKVEQAAANQGKSPPILDDLQLVITPPVRLMFLLFEADSWRASSPAGVFLLKGMLQCLPDSKVVEDLHGIIRVDGASQKNRRQTVHQMQELLTQSHVLRERGLPHKAAVDRQTFLSGFNRTPDRKRKRRVKPVKVVSSVQRNPHDSSKGFKNSMESFKTYRFCHWSYHFEF